MKLEGVSARFSVAEENEVAAIIHLEGRGFSPSRIEREDGLAVLIFEQIADERMLALAEALPIHLSAKVGVVTGSGAPFQM